MIFITSSVVMAGLDPATHVFATAGVKDEGTRDKPGYDAVGRDYCRKDFR
jgi:hypothetical protein